MRGGAFPDRFKVNALWGYFLFLSLLGPFSLQTAFAEQIEVDGRAYVALNTVGSHFGMRGYCLNSDGEIFRLSSKLTTIDFTKNSRFTKINRMPVYLGFSTVDLEDQLFVSVSDYQHVLQPILTPQIFPLKPSIRKIVIDAGHGGKDTGTRNDDYGLIEKNLVLDVSFRLKKLLERNGFQVKLTRRSDVFIPLEKRSEIANRYEADLFVSLHFNSAPSSEPSGFEAFALTPQHQPSTKYPEVTEKDTERFPGNDNDPWNVLAAYHFERALVQGIGGPDRGVKRARFSVLKDLECPGVLLELGFLSHPKTARKVRSADFRQLLAESLCQGVLTYRDRLNRIR